MIARTLRNNFRKIFEANCRIYLFQVQNITDFTCASQCLTAQSKVVFGWPSHHVNVYGARAETHSHSLTVVLAWACWICRKLTGPRPEVGCSIPCGQRNENFRRTARCADGGLSNTDVRFLERHKEMSDLRFRGKKSHVLALFERSTASLDVAVEKRGA